MKKKLMTVCVLVMALMLAGVPALSQEQQRAKEKPPEGGTPKAFTLPQKTTFTLKNGMRVTLVPYGSVPKVTVSAVVRAGNLNETAEQIWLANITGTMLKEGTRTRSAAQIAEDAARMGGQINVSVGADQTTITGDVLSEFGTELVALIADVAQNPLLPASELPRLKTDRLRQLTIAKTQPQPIANERFRKLLYPNHPYGRLYPTEEMINRYTIEDVQKFYKDNFGAARTNLYIAGRFDAAAMRKAITQAFEGWTRGADAAMDIPKPVAARTINLIDRPGAAQSTIYLGLPVVYPGHNDYIALQVTNALL